MRPHCTHAAPRRPRWRAAVLPSAIVALTGAWISGCSVLYDLKTEQCSIDADCNALGGTFTGLACIEHLCQTPPGCNSNRECIDTEGFGNEPWACINRDCVRLTTAECPTVLPRTNEGWLEALRDDNPVILAGTGVIGDGNFFDEFLKNYDLALTELNTKVGGINQGTRPLVMLGCQALFDSRDQLDSMMTHLTQTVEVPAFIAAMGADDLQYAFLTYGLPTNTFFMSPLQSDPALASIGDNGLLWHIGPGGDTIARTYAPLLRRTLEHLAISGTVRVASVVANGDRFMTDMMTTVSAAPESYGISFNELGVIANLAAENYLEITTEDLVNKIPSLVAFKPHVIISAAGGEFFSEVISGVEANWDAGSGQAKPFYLLSPLNFNDVAGLNQVLSGNAGVRTRLAGVNGAAAEDATNYDNYLYRYNRQFGRTDVGYENLYDAAYYVMYALGAMATTSPLTSGEDLPRGMRRLIGTSNPFNVGDQDLPNALAQVASGATIQLNGTMGPPNWNDNGTRNLPGSVYCVDGTGNFAPDVLRYRETTPDDASSVTLEGDFSCFDFGPATP